MATSTLQDVAAATTSELRTVYAAIKPLSGAGNDNANIDGLVRAIESEMIKREQPLVTLIGKRLVTGQDIIDLPNGTVFEGAGNRFLVTLSLDEGEDVIVTLGATPLTTLISDIQPGLTYETAYTVVLDPIAR